MISPERLRRYTYFAPVGEENLEQLAAIAKEKWIPAGENLFYEFDPANYLYVIVEGEVDVHYTLGNGEQPTADTLTDGDLLAWSALVEPYRMTATATAVMDTRVIAIRAVEFRALCGRDPKLGRCLMTQVVKLLANRLVGAQLQLAET